MLRSLDEVERCHVATTRLANIADSLRYYIHTKQFKLTLYGIYRLPVCNIRNEQKTYIDKKKSINNTASNI